jgi:hypothetical protein
MPSRPRTFRLDSPHMTGDDVGDFQRLLSRQFKRWDINLVVVDDNDYGQDTRDAARDVCKGLGILPGKAMRHGVTPALRTKLRHPARRTDREKERFKSPATKKFRKTLREKHKVGPSASRVGSLAAVNVTAIAGKPHWGGSNDLLTAFVEPFMVARGLPIGSGKRTPAENVAVGGSPTSDHLTTKTLTAARDFPTTKGLDPARDLAKAMGIVGWQPNVKQTFPLAPVDGRNFNMQILWGALIDHGDHVHVGISRA